jgi:hypothetical protein
MSYEPGHEVIMGHLLVPLQRGLFEIRLIAKEMNTTGLRESILVAEALGAAGGESPDTVMKRLRQRDFDDPGVDARFPEHPLSRVRAELRELLKGDSLAILEPDSLSPPGEVELPEIGCAVTPPPRYLRVTGEAPGAARFSRVSFAGTDGVQILSVTVIDDENLDSPRANKVLLSYGEQVAHKERSPDMLNLRGEARAIPAQSGRAQVMTYRAYEQTGGNAPQHTAFRFFVSEPGRLVMISIGTAQCVPKEEIFAEAEMVVASWRSLDAGDGARERVASKKKPWWRFW